LKELLEFMAKSLVEKADEVTVSEVESDGETVYQIQTAESDIGRVIGKQGRIIKAIRTVAKAAAVKEGIKIRVDVVE
jgi:predicted RNA-binding protein YlqC (UPF0109 family)